MAYQGYLLKIGDFIVPQDKILRAKSYKAYRNIQDLDSYRDTNGKLHREALDHVPLKVEFETVAMLTNKEYGDFMRNIQANYLIAKERRVSATVYVPELDDYVTQDMYFPDPKPNIYGTYGGVIHYDPIAMSLIGY